MKKHALRFTMVSIAVFVLCFALNILGVFKFLEYKSYDGRMSRTAPFYQADEEIAVVVIDQDSLDWAKEELGWSWPWPRSSYADMVRYFNIAKASCVAFDMMYTEPSLYGEQDDEDFAKANQEFGKTALAVHFLADENNEEGVRPVYPIETLKNSAGILSSVVSITDFDTVVRRNRYGFSYGGKIFPQLGCAPLVFKDLFSEEELKSLIENGKTVNLRFTSSLNDYIPYSAKTILKSWKAYKEGTLTEDSSDEDSDLIHPANFEGMAIFAGVYAPGLYDICSTPVSQVYPGIGVHVSLCDTLLNKNEITNLSTILPTTILIFIMTILGSAFIPAISSLKKKRAAVALSVAAVLVPIIIFTAAAYILFANGIWISLVSPLIAFFLSLISTTVAGYFSEGRQKKYIKTAFSQYLSPIVIDELMADPEKLKLGGERKEITCYFSDVQGFTSISEGLDPSELTSFLNEYTSEMSAVIMNSGGTIDKYEGDAIIAFWNAPTDQKDHARRALEAAIQCQERLEEMQDSLVKISKKSIKQRIGVNTGFAVVGNMGSKMRFNYTMLGDSVNLASRLEGQNKAFGTYTMCSSESKRAASEHGTNLKFRELARLQVVGKKEAITVFEPMSSATFSKREKILETFEKALALFYKADFKAARELFSSIAEQDTAAANYAQKCAELEKSSVPQDWDGRWIATSK